MARRKETTIERIFREVIGRKMSKAIKRILLHKRNARSKPLESFPPDELTSPYCRAAQSAGFGQYCTVFWAVLR
jgi:hypothetical protein